MRVRLLHQWLEHAAGDVVDIDDKRAKRLEHDGYAVVLPPDPPAVKKRKE